LPMESADQHFQQKENYGHMSERQLRMLAHNAYDLTDSAREALQAVITERGFNVQLKLTRPEVERPENDLVIFGWAKSAEEAELTMKTLAAAGIPSYLNVEVRSRDLQRADAAMLRAIDEELEQADPEDKDYAILCPRCRSAKVVMEGRDTDLAEPPPTAKFRWSCEDCGYVWVDDGVAQEAVDGQSWPGEEFPRDKDPSEEWDPRRMSKP
jgi:DNA-directed RNA polymerase subunit M/transcription elongation factor TFIIS